MIFTGCIVIAVLPIVIYAACTLERIVVKKIEEVING
jgi:hypothetical protein